MRGPWNQAGPAAPHKLLNAYVHSYTRRFLNPTQLLFGDPSPKSLKIYLAHLQSNETTLSNLDKLRPAWGQMITAAELKVSAFGGLACVVAHWKTGKVVSGSQIPGGPITEREQVCVILSSTGRPPNRCKDVNQILRCIFDLHECMSNSRSIRSSLVNKS